jgi:hypothetical protein
MTWKALTEFWGGILGRKVPARDAEPANAVPARVSPITVGLRIDFAVLLGTNREATASQFIWVSPGGSPRTVKALRVLLLSN